MKIPRYWVRGTVDGESGQPLEANDPAGFTAFGWSDHSHASAWEDALNRARSVARRIMQTDETIDPASTYWYPHRPLREQIIDEASDGQWIVTRNSYGSLILNTSHVIFADIDMSVVRRPGLLGRLLKLTYHPADTHYIERIRQVMQSMPQLGGRLYRTAAGLRLLITSDMAAPQDEFSQNLLQALGADEQYTRLCRVQESFRARLTPKYWRCGNVNKPPCIFPFPSENHARQYDQWVNAYEHACQRHGVCTLIEHLGSKTVLPEIQPVLELHDRHALARPNATLA